MLAKRIIPCLDVNDGKVVKGVQFKHHKIVGDIIDLAALYAESGADELVFYDISASAQDRTIEKKWINEVARNLDIPFCVAGGIRSLQDAQMILNAGADKISINSPALANPALIDKIVSAFGSQCLVIGIDSLKHNDEYQVCQYTGCLNKMRITERLTTDWIMEVQARGAGEIVLNCMDQDGVRQGYDIAQLELMRSITKIPLIASGGAGQLQHFSQVFKIANVDGALAASVFHSGEIKIPILKAYLNQENIRIR
ncbi:MAG: imidazole glycerol phosphate synthase subunit HisF [Proteobacteria bacterium]|nr:imidazole glycerol phosphate synthase subunit HisF [Pseudomonadota bacterium]